MIPYLIKTIKIIAIIIAVMLLLFVIINWGDEKLRPEVEQALNWQPPADAFEDNGYLVSLGMSAPIEQDAYQAGKAILEGELARYHVLQQTHKEPSAVARPDAYPDIDWQEILCTYQETQNCVDFYVKQDADILAALDISLKRFTDRFYAISHHKNYIEAIPPMSSAEPSYSRLVKASELERIRAITEIANGKLDAGVARFTDNAGFSRRWLRNSNRLVSHMVALNMLQRDMRTLSELMVKYPKIATEHYYDTLRMVLDPISLPEYSLKKPLASERDRILHSLVHSLEDDLDFSMSKLRASTLGKLLYVIGYQPNATTNLFYDLDTLSLQLAEAGPQQLDAIDIFPKYRHSAS